jgi:hypothetical protein
MDEKTPAPDYRSEFDQAVTTASLSFDKAVTTLAGGALGLSITFIHDIAPEPVHEGRIALAWVAFALALMFSMASFLTSEYAHRHLIKELDKGTPPEGLELGTFGWTTHVLNVGAAVLVVAGTFFLAYFAVGNL